MHQILKLFNIVCLGIYLFVKNFIIPVNFFVIEVIKSYKGPKECGLKETGSAKTVSNIVVNEYLEQVKEFVYLGSMFMRD